MAKPLIDGMVLDAQALQKKSNVGDFSAWKNEIDERRWLS